MRDFILYFFGALIISLLIGMFTHLTFYEGASVCLLIFNLFHFLGNLGKKVVVLDIAVILASFTWLVMPVIFYHNYTKEDHVARIFYKYMPIASDDYFSFVFPGTVAMTIGYKMRLARLQINANSEEYRQKVRNFFRGKDKIGYILIGISLVSSVLRYILPASIGRVIYLMEHLNFVGVFFIFFSENKSKGLILAGVIGYTLLDSIKTGLFGELVYSMALFYILIAMYLKQLSFATKLSICLGAIFFIFLIQNVKTVYRAYSWKEGASASYFLETVTDRLADPSLMFEKNKLFATAVRMNQGWLVGVTMDRVPRRFPYANGETIGISVASAFVPRIFWPDKPESGGKYNLKRFWGYNLVGYSMNIGPIGEAYANFGRTGGIIFMFFYGLFFNALLTFLLKWSEKKPSILCWIPFLYFYAVVVETDVLTTFSSLVTSFFFMILFIPIFRKITGIDL